MNLRLLPAFLALAWLLGIAAAAFTGADLAAAVGAAGLLGIVSFVRWPRLLTLALIAAGSVLIFAAAQRYDATTPEPSPITRLNGAAVRLRAIVDAEPDERGASRIYRLQVRERFTDGGWRTESGGVLMHAGLFPAYEYGDLLEIEGKLETPPVFEDFDYREYLLRRDIESLVDHPKIHRIARDQGSSVRSALFDLRSRLSDGLTDVLPEPEASLSAGILFGTPSSI